MMRWFYLMLVIVLYSSSCSLEKRLYRHGYYLDTRGNTESRLQETQEPVKKSLDATRLNSVDTNGTDAYQVINSEQSLNFDNVETDSVLPCQSMPVSESRIQKDTVAIRNTDQWRYAGLGVLTAFGAIFVGPFIMDLFPVTWFMYTIAGIFALAILFFIVLSIRAHWIFKAKNRKVGTQSPIVWLLRVLLYVFSFLGGAAIIAVVNLIQ